MLKAGTQKAGNGAGLTELIAAAGFHEVARGVGPWSMTRNLITALRSLSCNVDLTTSVLVNTTRSQMQSVRPRCQKPIPRVSPHHILLVADPNLPQRTIYVPTGLWRNQDCSSSNATPPKPPGLDLQPRPGLHLGLYTRDNNGGSYGTPESSDHPIGELSFKIPISDVSGPGLVSPDTAFDMFGGLASFLRQNFEVSLSISHTFSVQLLIL
jgi:hypothetical protein